MATRNGTYPPQLGEFLTRAKAAAVNEIIGDANRLASYNTAGLATDLREVVLNAMKLPLRPFRRDVADSVSDLNEEIRRRSGLVAHGTWFPLVGLHPNVRDLTSAGTSALHAAQIGRTAGPSLAPMSAVFKAGATMLSGLSGTSLGLPFVSTGIDAEACWVPENGAPVQKEPVFALAQLTPKTLAVEMIVTHQLLTNSSIDVSALLRVELGRRIGAAIDVAALVGDGVDQPLGLLERGDIATVAIDTNGGAVTPAHLAQMEYLVNADATPENPLAWLMSPKLARKLRTTDRGDGAPLFEGTDLLGHPSYVSAHVPSNLTKGSTVEACSALLLGDFSEVFVGFFGPAAIDLIVDSVTLAFQRKVRIVARCMVGVVARRPEVFALITDATT